MRAMPAFAAVLLTASLALAGCGGGASDSEQKSVTGGSAAGRKADVTGAGAPAAADSKGRQAAKPTLPTAQVIRTAVLTVRVKDTRKAVATARSAAERAGGLVQNESTEQVDDSHVESRVVLRVPQADYDSVLAELAGTGTLLARTSTAKDVTDQVVDVDSRIASQRVSVARVRELMNRATKLSDVVALEGQLSDREAALEALLAQQASLKDRTTLATITLEFSETKTEEKPKDDDPGFLDALGGGWNAFLGTLRWIVVVLGAVAPFAAALALLYALWRLLRSRLSRRPARSTVQEPPVVKEPPVVPAQPAPASQKTHERD
jgi:hypothetical protein